MAEPTNRYTCPHAACYRTYNSEKNLRRHTRAFHSDAVKYECEYCGKQLASSQNLREHTYLHTGEMPYPCGFPGCPRLFRQGSQLSAHRRTHREVQPSVPKEHVKELKVTVTQLTRLPGVESVLTSTLCQSAASVSPTILPSLTAEKMMGPLPHAPGLKAEEGQDSANIH